MHGLDLTIIYFLFAFLFFNLIAAMFNPLPKKGDSKVKITAKILTLPLVCFIIMCFFEVRLYESTNIWFLIITMWVFVTVVRVIKKK